MKQRLKSPRAFFVSYGGAHIAKIAPVVSELEQRGIECVVMALTLGYKQAIRLSLKPLGYRDFMHLVDAEAALRIGRSLLEENSHPDVDPHESACYLGVNYLEWVETYGPEEAARMYEQGGRRAFKPVHFMSNVIAQLRPDIVVSTSSPRSEQAAIEAAVAAGIPSLTMMDSFALPAEPYHRHGIRADRVTVMSELVKSNLISMGMDAERILVTGCPGFDSHFSVHLDNEARSFRAARGWDDLQVILWAGGIEESPGTPEEHAGPRLAMAVEEKVRAFVSEHEDTALIIRYHPSQYHLFGPAPSQPRVYISNPAEDSIELMIKVADTAIVQASTVGFEASLVGRRVLALTYSPAVKFTGLDYAAMGFAEAVPSLDLLLPTLDSPPQARPAVDGLSRGPAAPAVADVIMELAQRRVGTS